MKLYQMGVAPNPTKVRVYVLEKGLDIELVLVNLVKGEQKSPEHLERNPLGNLPVLELDDGTCLSESLAIIEYLEELYPQPPMIGVEPLERARVRRLERIADLGVLLPIAHIIHATRSPLGLDPVPEVAEWEQARLPKCLEVLDNELEGRPFVAGDNPTIADCTLWAALGFARFAGIEIDPRFENLARWTEEFGKRPSVKRA